MLLQVTQTVPALRPFATLLALLIFFHTLAAGQYSVSLPRAITALFFIGNLIIILANNKIKDLFFLQGEKVVQD